MVYCGSGTETIIYLVFNSRKIPILWSTAEAVLRLEE